MNYILKTFRKNNLKYFFFINLFFIEITKKKMEDEGFISLEKRIANLEKSLGIVDEEAQPKVKFDAEKDKKSLLTKLMFTDYKTKEISLSQIQNLIEKGINKPSNFLKIKTRK